MSSFVSVGNGHQPFTRLLDAIEAIADRLPQPVYVQHGHTPFASDRCRATAFISMDEFVKRISDSEILITHAGAGTIFSALQHSKMPIVVPRLAAFGEHIDDHQLGFARALSDASKVILVNDVSHLGNAAAAVLAGPAAGQQAPAQSPLIGLVRAALAKAGTLS